MHKSKIGIIFDSLIISFAMFILLQIWLAKFTKNANHLLFLTITASLCVFLIIYVLFNRHSHKQKNAHLSSKFLNSCIEYLSLADYETYNNYFKKLFNCTVLDNYLYKIKNSYIYINLQYNITDKDYIEILNKIKENNFTNNSIYFITKNQVDFVDNLQKFNFKINTFQTDTFVKIIQEKNVYPINNTQKNNYSFSQKFKSYISSKIILSRKQFINLFFTGISLLFISIFIPFSFIYLLIGSILLSLSIFCLFKKNIKPLSKENEFFNQLKKDN